MSCDSSNVIGLGSRVSLAIRVHTETKVACYVRRIAWGHSVHRVSFDPRNSRRDLSFPGLDPKPRPKNCSNGIARAVLLGNGVLLTIQTSIDFSRHEADESRVHRVWNAMHV